MEIFLLKDLINFDKDSIVLKDKIGVLKDEL